MLARFCLAIAMLFAAMVLPAQVSVAPMASDLQGYVAILTRDIPGYNQALQSLMSDRDIATISPVLPFCVIVQNVSTGSLRGINVVFWETDVSGHSRPYSLASTNMDPDTAPILAPGQSRLFVPWASLYSAIFRKQPVERGLGPNVTPAGLAAQLSAYRSITASVEHVITSNGQLLGPDTLDLFSMIRAEQQGQALVARTLATYAASPHSARMQQLQALAATPETRSSNPFKLDFYNRQVRRDSARLLRSINAGIADAADSYVARVAREIPVTKP